MCHLDSDLPQAPSQGHQDGLATPGMLLNRRERPALNLGPSNFRLPNESELHLQDLSPIPQPALSQLHPSQSKDKPQRQIHRNRYEG